MSPEGDINQAKAEPAENTTSALQNEYNSVVNLARADFGVTPDQTITRPPADSYYVNNGDQQWRAKPDNNFVPPADNKTSDPYFNPNASRPWRANPFDKGGTEFRRPTDPVIQPQDPRDPRSRQVIPNQSYVPEQYLPQNQQFIPGYVAPNQQFTQFNPQFSPEYNPQFISNNGIPAYSGMGFQFTSNFYNVGERPAMNFAGNMTYVPQGGEIPAVKIDTAFPGQKSFFGVPLTTNDGVINNPTVITVPKGDNTLPIKTIPVQTIPLKFEPGVVPPVDTSAVIPRVTDPALATTERVVVNPVINPISSEINGPTKVASEALSVLPTQTTSGVEVRPLTTAADQTLIAQTNPKLGTLPTDSSLPANNVLVPVDQKTVTRSNDTTNSLYNETYRYVTAVPATATWMLSGGLPRTTQGLSDFASKWTRFSVRPDINLSAKFRDPSGAIVGLTAYELANKYVFNLGNPQAPESSVVGNITIPAGILAYRAMAPNATYRGLGAMVMAGTTAATFYGDKAFSGLAKDTTFGTHTAFDDVAMIGGMYAANRIATPAALTNWNTPALANKVLSDSAAKALPGVLGNGFFKVGVLATSFVAGNMLEKGWNYFFPGTKTLASRAQSAMDSDGTTRTADSLATARKSFSTLSDSQWTAAQAEYAKVKADSEALNAGQNNWEQRAISDRKVIILAGAIGENYLNNGTRVSSQGNTFLGKGTDIDMNSQALSHLREARDAAYRLIRKYNENVLPATINGTPVNKAVEVAALEQEIQRINGVMKRVFEPHNYEAAMPEMVKAANEKPADFFTNFVRYNGDNAAQAEQSLRSQGLWDRPDSTEERRAIAKRNADKAFALMVLAQRALDVNAGREAVELIIGKKNSSDPTTNVRSALIVAKNQFNGLADLNPGDIENINRLTKIFIRLNAQIKAKFPAEYAANS